MPHDDHELDRLLRAADPVRAADITVPARFTPARRRYRRPLLVVPAVALTVAGATAGAYAWVADDGTPADSVNLTCAMDGYQAGADFDAAGGVDPVQACLDTIAEAGAFPVPTGPLTACVARQDGTLWVYPGEEEVCEENDAVVYTGTTDEQRRFALFREELLRAEDFAGVCLSRDELEERITGLLEKHGLGGWTVEDGPTGIGSTVYSGVNVADCEESYGVGFREAERVVTISLPGLD
ncbi:hypothetical protein [Streptomyces sp. URMC 129]|uniref:hypothetical protein n=1 Tax=Streptomyces sp. URMC 129 TaxID=3423407 RepID=UPI003F1E18BE